MDLIEINTAVKIRPGTWAEFKKYIDGTFKELPLQYFEIVDDTYACFCVDGPVGYYYYLYINESHRHNTNPSQNTTDITDFENNWKVNANKKLDRTQVDLDTSGGIINVDGVSIKTSALVTGWYNVTYALPSQLTYKFEVYGAHLNWKDCFLGDYFYVNINNPAAQTTLASALSGGSMEIDVGDDDINGTPRYALYDPATNNVDAIEIWKNGAPQEQHFIDSINSENNKVVLKTPVVSSYSTSDTVKLRVGSFSPITGTKGISSGFKLSNQGEVVVKNEYATIPITAGLDLSVNLKTTSDIGSRQLLINFIMLKKKI